VSSETPTPSWRQRAAFILASASPRRRQLLEAAGYRFDVEPSTVDESQVPTEGLSPADCAGCLALAKARDIAWRRPEQLVLGADTLVHCDGRIIGKARDAEHAERITRLLFGRPHEVITGLALVRIDRDIEIVEADVTVVYPRPMSDEDLARHIASQRWQDKAGAYAIQDDDAFIERLEGSFSNVVGLPMELLARMFDRLRLEF